jgi:hypothetical protein
MKLKKMALVAEVLGGVGIIISILYLAYEVSQNSESMQLSHHLTLSDQYLALRQSLSEEADLAKIMVKGSADFSALEPFERLQFEAYLTSFWDIWENAHYMFDTGRIDPGTWTNWNRALCLRIASEGSAAAWSNGLYREFSPAFVSIANQCFAESNLQTPAINF